MYERDIRLNNLESKLPTVDKLIERAKNLQLDGIEIFEKFSIDEIRKFFNYIGPDRWPSWVRILCSYIIKESLEAVIIHDCDFEYGGTKEEFYKSNLRLKNNLLKLFDLRKHKLTLFKRIFDRLQISLSYKICNSKIGFKGWKLREN